VSLRREGSVASDVERWALEVVDRLLDELIDFVELIDFEDEEMEEMIEARIVLTKMIDERRG
jgi:hypothetical protein